ncbi:Hypothetical protein DIP1592 [Corynebacterium diphtheriae]|uniref:Uncharacterized protein n=1 Tax=Corynebacterium diphtheriae (strain ATCC 700971 / NCTC 13129 / Biotype gravis) TaxID=257309 RepID=Q6NGD4_CORDI|nr:Hypothetical protein DIP1592 [Corynebacterium diphtheriae]
MYLLQRVRTQRASYLVVKRLFFAKTLPLSLGLGLDGGRRFSMPTPSQFAVGVVNAADVKGALCAKS